MTNIKFSNLILHVPGLVPFEECNLIIREFDKQDTPLQHEIFLNSLTNTTVDKTSYNAIKINPLRTAFEITHNYTEIMINKWIDHLKSLNSFSCNSLKKNIRFSNTHRILRYPTGAIIEPHVDWSPGIFGSCTLNLNDDYEGGELSFFHRKHDIILKKGDAVIFPADFFWTHEIKPITKGVRYCSNTLLQMVADKHLRLLVDKSNEYVSNTIPTEYYLQYNNE